MRFRQDRSILMTRPSYAISREHMFSMWIKKHCLVLVTLVIFEFILGAWKLLCFYRSSIGLASAPRVPVFKRRYLISGDSIPRNLYFYILHDGIGGISSNQQGSSVEEKSDVVGLQIKAYDNRHNA